MYVYIQSEKHEFGGLWTVGHYDPSGEWIPESDHNSTEEAADRVRFLNGGKIDRKDRSGSLGPTGHGDICYSDADPGL